MGSYSFSGQNQEMVRRRANRKFVVIGLLAMVSIVALTIAVIVLAVKLDRDNSEEIHQEQQKECKMSSAAFLLQHFGAKDGLDLRWFPRASSRTDIDKALREKVNLIETTVIDVGGIFYILNQELSLFELFTKLSASSIAVKLDFVPTPLTTRRLLSAILDSRFRNPVIVSLPVFSSSFNWTQFLSEEVDRIPDNVIINFDLRTECCATNIGHGTVEYIDQLYHKLRSKACVELDTESIKTSWETVRWLLVKNEPLALVVSTYTSVYNDTSFDALVIRNDIDAASVFYNFDGTLYNEFIFLASTAGSALIYFNIVPPDAGQIIWSHNTDTWEQLNAATAGPVMMIEGDIQVLGQGTSNQTNIPIMGHDIGDFNNLTFEQWIDEIIKVDKGMKFDFKTIDAVRPALQITKRKRDQIKGPIWLNADILKGPNAGNPRVPKDQFLAAIKDFPEATLSLGWSTVAKGSNYGLNYTMDMVREMHDVCKTLNQPITFPVRAEQLVDSWDAFDWLLKQSRGYTLTVWTSPTDNVTKSEMEYVKRQAEAARVYFDLPEELRPTFNL